METARDKICKQTKENMMRNLKIYQIKNWEQEGYTFIEIVSLFNAKFGTDYFKELFIGSKE